MHIVWIVLLLLFLAPLAASAGKALDGCFFVVGLIILFLFFSLLGC